MNRNQIDFFTDGVGRRRALWEGKDVAAECG